MKPLTTLAAALLTAVASCASPGADASPDYLELGYARTDGDLGLRDRVGSRVEADTFGVTLGWNLSAPHASSRRSATPPPEPSAPPTEPAVDPAFPALAFAGPTFDQTPPPPDDIDACPAPCPMSVKPEVPFWQSEEFILALIVALAGGGGAWEVRRRRRRADAESRA